MCEKGQMYHKQLKREKNKIHVQPESNSLSNLISNCDLHGITDLVLYLLYWVNFCLKVSYRFSNIILNFMDICKEKGRETKKDDRNWA